MLTFCKPTHNLPESKVSQHHRFQSKRKNTGMHVITIMLLIRSAIKTMLRNAMRCDAKGVGMFKDEPAEGDATLAHWKGIARTKQDLRETDQALTCVGFVCIVFSSFIFRDISSEGMIEADGYFLCFLPTTVMKLACGCMALSSVAYSRLASDFSPKVHIWTKFITLGMVMLNRVGSVLFLVWFAKNWHQNGIFQSQDTFNHENFMTSMQHHPTYLTCAIIKVMGGIINAATSMMLVGSIAVVAKHKVTILAGQVVNHHRGYFMLVYLDFSLIMTVLALSKAFLGVYLTLTYGFGVLLEPVQAGFLTVHFPALFLISGITETILGAWAVIRFWYWKFHGRCIPMYGSYGNTFAQIICIILLIGILQLVGQAICITDSENLLGIVPNAATCCGNFFIIGWLDMKVCKTERRVDRSDYTLHEETKCDDDWRLRVMGITEGSAPETDHKCSFHNTCLPLESGTENLDSTSQMDDSMINADLDPHWSADITTDTGSLPTESRQEIV